VTIFSPPRKLRPARRIVGLQGSRLGLVALAQNEVGQEADDGHGQLVLVVEDRALSDLDLIFSVSRSDFFLAPISTEGASQSKP